jgi:hypothetical protein
MKLLGWAKVLLVALSILILFSCSKDVIEESKTRNRVVQTKYDRYSEGNFDMYFDCRQSLGKKDKEVIYSVQEGFIQVILTTVLKEE